jgi:uncharacterized protein YdhG (YjbR/CyaY superfamily)
MSAPAQTVDAYLAALPADQRSALEALRATIREAVPSATEKISYRVPTFFQGGGLIAYSAHNNHLSLHLMSPAVAKAHREELKPYRTTTATVHFSPEDPLPVDLVRRLVAARVTENTAQSKNK